MLQPPSRPALTLGLQTAALVATGLLAMAAPAVAADKYWSFASGCSSQDFSSTCWSGSFPAAGPALSGPTLVNNQRADSLRIVHNASQDLPVSFANVATGPIPSFLLLEINGTGSGTPTLNVARNTLDALVAVVGTAGRGALNQTGGNVQLGDLAVGYLQGGQGRYAMSGGSLVVDRPGNPSIPVVGGGGHGTLEVSGSASVALPLLQLGALASGSGEYLQSGGNARVAAFGVGTSGEAGGQGLVRVSGGVLDTDGIARWSDQARATIELWGGTLNITQGAWVNEFKVGHASFNQKAGTTVVIGETLSLAPLAGQVASYVNAGGSLTVGNVIQGAGTGSLVVNGGSLQLTGNFLQASTLSLDSVLAPDPVQVAFGAGQSITVGTLNVGSLGRASLVIGGGAQLRTTSTLLGERREIGPLGVNFVGDGTLRVTGVGTTWVNTGALVIGGSNTKEGGVGRLEVRDAASVQIGGVLTNWAGGTVEIGSSGLLQAQQVDNRGLLTGEGFVLAALTNRGHIRPGQGVGALAIDGTLTQTAAGSLDLDLASALSFDRLIMSGRADLGGTLSLSCVTGCHFLAGDTLEILSAYGGVSGSFATISLIGLPLGSVELLYGANDVQLRVLNAVGVVPEPSTAALLLGSLVWLAGVATRREPMLRGRPVVERRGSTAQMLIRWGIQRGPASARGAPTPTDRV